MTTTGTVVEYLKAADLKPILDVIGSVVPFVGHNAELIDKTIKALQVVVPAVAKGASELLPIAKSIIADLGNSSAITEEQWVAIDQLNKIADDAFEVEARAFEQRTKSPKPS